MSIHDVTRASPSIYDDKNFNSKLGEEQKKKVIKSVEVPISTQIRLKSKKIGQSVDGLILGLGRVIRHYLAEY